MYLLPQLLPTFPKTPHSGYHWDQTSRRFFEGWYQRITLLDQQQSFCFIHSIEDPDGSSPSSGGATQVLGPDDAYVCRTYPDVRTFWAWQESLGAGHWGKLNGTAAAPGYLEPDQFEQSILQGYQLTARLHQGNIEEPTGTSVRWRYHVQPIYGWGNPKHAPRFTGSWLSSFDVFEPGWQILIAHGLATGWIEWNNTRYEFSQAPVYCEKNWGGVFPQKWFWLNCNCFDQIPDLTLTAGGGKQGFLWWKESMALVGIHYQGEFYEFVSWNSTISWTVHPWGYWHITAENKQYIVEITGVTSHPGTSMRVPTENGLVVGCRDTTHGSVDVQLWERDRLIVQAHSNLGGLEVGGAPWDQVWRSQDEPPSATQLLSLQ